METYETIGIAVRQHDAIRLSIKRGELATYYIAAAEVARLFEGATVPLSPTPPRRRLRDSSAGPGSGGGDLLDRAERPALARPG